AVPRGSGKRVGGDRAWVAVPHGHTGGDRCPPRKQTSRREAGAFVDGSGGPQGECSAPAAARGRDRRSAASPCQAGCFENPTASVAAQRAKLCRDCCCAQGTA